MLKQLVSYVSGFAAMVGCMFCFCWAMPTGGVHADQQQKVLLDPETDPYATLYYALQESGWSPQWAGRLAAQMMNIAVGEEPAAEPFEPAANVVLDPDSDPFVVLYEQFHDSGWSREEAVDHAAHAMGLEGNAYCWMSTATIMYCVNGQPARSRKVRIDGYCFDDYLASCIVLAPYCNQGERTELRMTIASNCFGLANGTCVRVRIDVPQWMPCDQDCVGCECFEEANPLDCQAIESDCCNTQTGCLTCPEC